MDLDSASFKNQETLVKNLLAEIKAMPNSELKYWIFKMYEFCTVNATVTVELYGLASNTQIDQKGTSRQLAEIQAEIAAQKKWLSEKR